MLAERDEHPTQTNQDTRYPMSVSDHESTSGVGMRCRPRVPPNNPLERHLTEHVEHEPFPLYGKEEMKISGIEKADILEKGRSAATSSHELRYRHSGSPSSGTFFASSSVLGNSQRPNVRVAKGLRMRRKTRSGDSLEPGTSRSGSRKSKENKSQEK